MKFYLPALFLSFLLLSCKAKPDEELLALQDAYEKQYSSICTNLLGGVYGHKILYQYGPTEYLKYITDVMDYVQKNDSILNLDIPLNINTVDSIKLSYASLIDEYKKYNPFSNPDKNTYLFPEFNGDETSFEKRIKIKQSNIYLLQFFTMTDYWLNKGEHPYAPRPELVFTEERNDSLFFSFIFGSQTFPVFSEINIVNDTLWSGGEIITDARLVKENKRIYISTPNWEKGKYKWTGDLLLHDTYTNSMSKYKEHAEFEIK